MSNSAGTQSSAGTQWLRESIRLLPPGSFAFVMATGIVSTALGLVGAAVLSVVLLVVAVLGAAVLAVAVVWRLVAYRADVLRDARDPARAFGFLTLVAGINVLGNRLYDPDAPLITIVLGLISVPLWLLLTYGIPANLMLYPRPGSAVAMADGSWFLWVVATQSLATAAAALGRDFLPEALGALAVALWGIGVMLYLMLATLVTLRLLTASSKPESMNPSYWIYMGATAITVLAGSRILRLPSDLPIMHAAGEVVSGLTFLLWAFGVWWVPLLVVFGVWRHVAHHAPLRYESGLWSIVFPLGMYSVASMHYGREMDLSLMATIGQIGTWIAALAWLAATAAMALSLRRGSRRQEYLLRDSMQE